MCSCPPLCIAVHQHGGWVPMWLQPAKWGVIWSYQSAKLPAPLLPDPHHLSTFPTELLPTSLPSTFHHIALEYRSILPAACSRPKRYGHHGYQEVPPGGSASYFWPDLVHCGRKSRVIPRNRLVTGPPATYIGPVSSSHRADYPINFFDCMIYKSWLLENIGIDQLYITLVEFPECMDLYNYKLYN